MFAIAAVDGSVKESRSVLGIGGGRNNRNTGDGCTRRDVRNPQPLPGIDGGGASHTVAALQPRIGRIVRKGDAKEGISALHDIASHPAEGRSARDDRYGGDGRNV